MFFTDSIEKPPDVGIVGVVTGDGNTLTPCCGDLVGSVLDGALPGKARRTVRLDMAAGAARQAR